MAEYYGDICGLLQDERELTQRTPHTAADLLAQALPFMSFVTVIDDPISTEDEAKDDEEEEMHMSQSTGRLGTSMSKADLPYEAHYNNALGTVLEHTLGYQVSRPENPLTGKTDGVAKYTQRKTCALEVIMAVRTQPEHDEHASRFSNSVKSNYNKADLKGLVIIGSNKGTVLKRVKETTGKTEDQTSEPDGLEIIGVVVSPPHDTYEVQESQATGQIKRRSCCCCQPVEATHEEKLLYHEA
ncbi:expressed unknown protein [Seminavis robusta]|uniref:Uncharacterized protein n=1 Tax=Seminavis robusta TaxID=568900 RepID=A0A9N8EII8_9STRA|nr:expressed unknown protein [Seminavis robusta]|eukprot:Sro1156_g247290.1 n/a (242) ;mRNA; f:22891-23763